MKYRLFAVALALGLSACSTAGSVPEPGGATIAQPAASHWASKQGASGTLTLRLTIPKADARRALRSATATEGLTYAVTGNQAASGTVSVERTARGCRAKDGGVFCTIDIPNLAACPSAANCYAIAISTFNAVACKQGKCTIPQNAKQLSANQGFSFTIAAGPNAVDLAIDAVPAGIALVPGPGSTLTPGKSNGFTDTKCLGSERIEVIPTDAGGDYVLGADAPVPTLTSSNTQIATIATPPPSARNRFTLNGPFANGAPQAGAVPAPGATFQLTAKVTPSAGGTVSQIFPVTLDRTICGVFSEFAIPTANANAYYIASGPDGAVWFTEEGFQGNPVVPSKIGRITTSGTITETPLASGFFNAEDITTGSDGALYFVEFQQSPFVRAVGRISAAGTITSNTLTATIDNDGEIVAAPGSGAWIGDYAGSSSSTGITAVSSAGQATQLPLAGASYLWGLATGANGNVWYTDYGAGDIGVVSPAGAPIGTYPLQDGDKGPLWMTLGPDGNVWFVSGTTASGTSAVYNVTPSGALTRFTVPYSINFIAAGPDGALWLSPDGNPSIVRITTSGAVSAPFTVPSGDNANSITQGPDGNLWFVEPHKNNIGRLQ